MFCFLLIFFIDIFFLPFHLNNSEAYHHNYSITQLHNYIDIYYFEDTILFNFLYTSFFISPITSCMFGQITEHKIVIKKLFSKNETYYSL